jgi:capsular polysaccharide biosynthesis protein
VQTGTDIPLDQLATRIVASRLRSQLDFEAAGSGIYRIIVTDSDPRNAQLLARWISEMFADVSVESALDELKRAHEFGAEQLKIYEEQLLQSERRLESYKQGQIEANLDRSIVRANNVAVAEALYRRVVDEVEHARFRSLPFARSVAAAGQDRVKDGLLADAQIQSQFVGMVTTLKDAATNRLMGDKPEIGEWPPTGNYITLRRALYQLIERKSATAAAEQSTQVRDDLCRSVFSTLDHQSHSQTAGFLEAAISDFKRQAQSEPRDEMELARLQSEVTTNRELLNSFRAQLVASDVTQAAETTNLGLRIEILDPPQLPLAPSSPNRMMILIAALALGPILGIGVALASEIMDTTLRSLADFERVFRGPVLGTTPLLSRVPAQQVRIRRYWVPATVTVIVLVTAAFLLTRENLLRDFVAVGQTVRAIDPKDSVTP